MSNRAPLAANRAGTRRAGAILPPLLAFTATSRMEHADVAMIIVGSAV
jgi:hypothetical protein